MSEYPVDHVFDVSQLQFCSKQLQFVKIQEKTYKFYIFALFISIRVKYGIAIFWYALFTAVMVYAVKNIILGVHVYKAENDQKRSEVYRIGLRVEMQFIAFDVTECTRQKHEVSCKNILLVPEKTELHNEQFRPV